MSSYFVLTSVSIEVDGAVVYTQTDPNALANLGTIPVAHALALGAGPHLLRTHVTMRLAPPTTPWVEQIPYRFDVKSAEEVHVMSGGVLEERIIAYERGGVTTPIEERPGVRYTVAYF